MTKDENEKEQRRIKVIKGNEFRIFLSKETISKDDIFYDQYINAAMCVDEIVNATYEQAKIDRSKNKTNERNRDYLNNIISFCGERGQGKSSAMITFMNELQGNLNESNLTFSSRTKDSKFINIGMIDPSNFENFHGILEIILARLFKEFQSKYNDDKTDIVKWKKKDILQLFQGVYQNISTINNLDKMDKFEGDFESSLQKLSKIGDSSALREDFIKLIKLYLELQEGDSEKSFLVIPVDDLDTSIEVAYKMAEQIRKYLLIPNVIIVMALNINQMRYCVEKEFVKQLGELGRTKSDFVKREANQMAARYIDKLIPNGRRFFLPGIEVIAKNSQQETAVEYVEYIDGKEELILDKNTGMEKAILKYIYQNTQIVFTLKENILHPIIPNNLRELVSLLATLGKMEKLENCNEKEEMLQKNLKLFKDYFINTWIVNNMEDIYFDIIKELIATDPLQQHKYLCNQIFSLFQIDENEEIDLFGYERTTKRDNAKRLLNNKNRDYSNFSLADAISMLEELQARSVTKEAERFVCAVKILYTIQMHEMSFDKKNNNLISFLGGRIWSKGKQNEMMRKSKDYEDGRAFFETNTTGVFIRYLNINDNKDIKDDKDISDIKWKDGKLESVNGDGSIDEGEGEIKKLLSISSVLLNYKKTTIEPYENNTYPLKPKYSQMLKKADFSLDNLFLTYINLSYKYDLSGMGQLDYSENEYKEILKRYLGINSDIVKKFVINIDLLEQAIEINISKRNLRDNMSEKQEEYFIRFLNNVNIVLENTSEYLTNKKQMWDLFGEADISDEPDTDNEKVEAEPNTKMKLADRKAKGITELSKLYLCCLEARDDKKPRGEEVLKRAEKIKQRTSGFPRRLPKNEVRVDKFREKLEKYKEYIEEQEKAGKNISNLVYLINDAYEYAENHIGDIDKDMKDKIENIHKELVKQFYKKN